MSNACPEWLLVLTFAQVKALQPKVCKTAVSCSNPVPATKLMRGSARLAGLGLR